MMEIEVSYVYYGITLFLMVGCGVMSFLAGQKEGIVKMIDFLVDHSDNNNVVKLHITDHEFEFLSTKD